MFSIINQLRLMSDLLINLSCNPAQTHLFNQTIAKDAKVENLGQRVS